MSTISTAPLALLVLVPLGFFFGEFPNEQVIMVAHCTEGADICIYKAKIPVIKALVS